MPAGIAYSSRAGWTHRSSSHASGQPRCHFELCDSVTLGSGEIPAPLEATKCSKTSEGDQGTQSVGDGFTCYTGDVVKHTQRQQPPQIARGLRGCPWKRGGLENLFLARHYTHTVLILICNTHYVHLLLDPCCFSRAWPLYFVRVPREPGSEI